MLIRPPVFTLNYSRGTVRQRRRRKRKQTATGLRPGSGSGPRPAPRTPQRYNLRDLAHDH